MKRFSPLVLALLFAVDCIVLLYVGTTLLNMPSTIAYMAGLLFVVLGSIATCGGIIACAWKFYINLFRS